MMTRALGAWHLETTNHTKEDGLKVTTGTPQQGRSIAGRRGREGGREEGRREEEGVKEGRCKGKEGGKGGGRKRV